MRIKQQQIINKIYAYLEAVDGNLEYQIKSGICAGLTDLWLSCVSNNALYLFDECIDYVLKYVPSSGQRDAKMESIISTFFILQKSIYYLEDPTQKNLTEGINLIKPSNDFSELIEEISLINTFSRDELDQLFISLPENALLRVDNIKHTIGITKQNGEVTIYDPNIGVTKNDLFEIFNANSNEIISLHICGYSTRSKHITYDLPITIINKPITDKTKALCLAVVANNNLLVRNLIEDGADINGSSDSPLDLALCTYQYSAAQILIEHGAKLDIQINNQTPLLITIAQTKLGYYNGTPLNLGFVALSMLLDSGADPNFTNAQGLTPVSFAIYRKQLLKLALLLVYGANLESHNVYSLVESFANTPKIWQLYQDIKYFKKILNKSTDIDLSLLKIANFRFNLDTSTDFANDCIEFLECIKTLKQHGLKKSKISIIEHDNVYTGAKAFRVLQQRILEYIHDAAAKPMHAWKLYELSKPWSQWGCGNQISNELINLFNRLHQTVLRININTLDRNEISFLITSLDTLNHFVHLTPLSIARINLRHAANEALIPILKHFTVLLKLESPKQVLDRLKLLQQQQLDALQQNSKSLLAAPQLQFRNNPSVDQVIAAVGNKIKFRAG